MQGLNVEKLYKTLAHILADREGCRVSVDVQPDPGRAQRMRPYWQRNQDSKAWLRRWEESAAAPLTAARSTTAKTRAHHGATRHTTATLCR